mmetsp:Transcript_23197/g.34028  ORF Transcript_23197/g.34028 Transcript_23197/m.34028 type:complete len:974 (+) Transcript_23197:241-3162(+)|eukprot:CAMPEP_0185030086 /NCGR_PEP_ID=MMETSP1103-20130426/16839_1 /TAXON_ID=36769 /ORGANISM="Paraphysomonas bandaiensis, Strain Caron Lab Isolate" /LENGTH=973 /DNA_ID=CAMNT_0027565071 /DNA_START=189 /DNA_END=3110 /DNA_ORIENTATION=-
MASSSKAGKLRGKIGAFAREREEFEQKKRELQEEMNKEKHNMGKIRKGMRGNDIKMDTETDDVSPDENNVPKLQSKKSMRHVYKSTETPSPDTLAKVPPIPSCPKVSDWAYTGDINSSPPVVKSQELYEDVRFLGRGSYGTVDLVKNREDNRLYASKTLLLQHKSEEKAFLHEVKYLRAHRHPFIVHLHDVFMSIHPKKVFLIMHYCEGGDLGKVITMTERNKTFLQENQVLKWISQVALALSYLHSFGIAHRDIKPVNILLTDSGELAQLADFGLATEVTDSTAMETAEVGTPYYTSPEMINNSPSVLASDNWALGVVLFEMLTLQLPFDGVTTVDLVRSILHEPPRRHLIPQKHYTNDVVHLIDGLLEKDINSRMTVNQFLQQPVVYHKAAMLPTSYRPKYLEERLRRYHVRQMTIQLDKLGIAPGSNRPPRSSQGEEHIDRVGHPSEATPPSVTANASPIAPVSGGNASSSPALSIAIPPDMKDAGVAMKGSPCLPALGVTTSHSCASNLSTAETVVAPGSLSNRQSPRDKVPAGIAQNTALGVVEDDTEILHKHGVGAIEHASNYLKKHQHHSAAPNSTHSSPIDSSGNTASPTAEFGNLTSNGQSSTSSISGHGNSVSTGNISSLKANGTSAPASNSVTGISPLTSTRAHRPANSTSVSPSPDDGASVLRTTSDVANLCNSTGSLPPLKITSSERPPSTDGIAKSARRVRKKSAENRTASSESSRGSKSSRRSRENLVDGGGGAPAGMCVEGMGVITSNIINLAVSETVQQLTSDMPPSEKSVSEITISVKTQGNISRNVSTDHLEPKGTVDSHTEGIPSDYEVPQVVESKRSMDSTYNLKVEASITPTLEQIDGEAHAQENVTPKEGMSDKNSTVEVSPLHSMELRKSTDATVNIADFEQDVGIGHEVNAEQATRSPTHNSQTNTHNAHDHMDNTQEKVLDEHNNNPPPIVASLSISTDETVVVNNS